MARHSIAETKNKLSELIDRAAQGETIVITRHGKEVATLNATKPLKRVTLESLDWLDRVRVGSKMPSEDAVTTIRKMREEDDF